MFTNPHIAKLLVEAHIDDLRRRRPAGATGGVPPARPAAYEAFRRQDPRVVPVKARRFSRAKRTLTQASEPCT